MERDKDKKKDSGGEENEKIAPYYEQNGAHFTPEDEEREENADKHLLHHGRPLSDAEIEELRLHRENNKFLGIPDTPEVGTGAGNVGGIVPDPDDMLNSTDDLDDTRERDSNFGRNYQGGMQSQDHFIETESQHEDEKQRDKKKGKD